MLQCFSRLRVLLVMAKRAVTAKLRLGVHSSPPLLGAQGFFHVLTDFDLMQIAHHVLTRSVYAVVVTPALRIKNGSDWDSIQYGGVVPFKIIEKSEDGQILETTARLVPTVVCIIRASFSIYRRWPAIIQQLKPASDYRNS